jgi:urease subunit alpha
MVGGELMRLVAGLVTLDGEPLHSEPAESVSLNRLYFL